MGEKRGFESRLGLPIARARETGSPTKRPGPVANAIARYAWISWPSGLSGPNCMYS
jgi:hypothetical protein